MKCPLDQTQLTLADRQGIEIDYCPTCRGVWLDRGELDKLIERSAGFAPQERKGYEHGGHDDRHEPRGHRDYDDHHPEHRGHHGKHHKKESFLGDLFDF